MQTLPILLLTVFLVGVAIALWATPIYNRLFRLEKLAENSWGDLNKQLKRRYGFVPDLLNETGAYMGHEQGLLNQITQTLEQAKVLANSASKENHKQIITLELMLSDLLRRFVVTTANQPGLKVSNHYREQHLQLVEIENAIQMAQHHYNNAAQSYNAAVTSKSDALIARVFKFKPLPLFM